MPLSVLKNKKVVINMKKSIITVILSILLLSVCGCTPSTQINSTTTTPSESTPSLTTAPSTPTVNPPTTEPTVETTVPVDKNIEIFTNLFTPHFDYEATFKENYYNTAMCCEFSCPEELPLATFFRNGLANSDVTDEEQAYVSNFYEAKRLEPDEMNEVLQAYFDITLDNINWDVVEIRYWDKTGCYYTAGNDVLCNEGFTITSVEELENDIFKIYYCNAYSFDNFVITVQSRQSEGKGGYRILSNLPA